MTQFDYVIVGAGTAGSALACVRGAANLRVVDASVLPFMVSGNSNAPITALFWGAAEEILGAE